MCVYRWVRARLMEINRNGKMNVYNGRESNAMCNVTLDRVISRVLNNAAYTYA